MWVEGGSERIELGLEEGEADWLVTHTLLGGPIEDVFIQVAEFLREHQREVVLLDLQHVRAAPTAEAHAKLLGQARAHFFVFFLSRRAAQRLLVIKGIRLPSPLRHVACGFYDL